LIVEQRDQQMLRFDLTVIKPQRSALGVSERLLKFGREFVETHGGIP
jgi:hypothetical protein